jgi:hypothetical protein
VHVVSAPVARSPPGRVLPGAHATHAWFDTYWFTEHTVAVHVVSAPVARSPAGRVLPGAHATHAWFDTWWFTEHTVAVHAVSGPVERSPAGRVLPAAHGTHAWFDTCSFAEHRRINVAAWLVALPWPLLAIARYAYPAFVALPTTQSVRPSTDGVAAGSVAIGLQLVPPFVETSQTTVGSGLPVTFTVNVAVPPLVTVWSCGPLIAGAEGTFV